MHRKEIFGYENLCLAILPANFAGMFELLTAIDTLRAFHLFEFVIFDENVFIQRLEGSINNN